MSEIKVHLSESATEMFRLIMKGVQNCELRAINFPILLYGILNSNDEVNLLDRYFTEQEFPYESILDSLANLINAHFVKLVHPDVLDSTQMVKYPILFTATSNHSSSKKKGRVQPSLKGKRTSKTSDDSKDLDVDLKSIVAVIIIKSANGKMLRLPVDATVYSIFEKIFQYIDRYSIQVIEVYHFIAAMFEVPNKELKLFFDQNSLDYAAAKKYFSPAKIFKLSVIPLEMSSFLDLMNDKVDINKPCEILMRDKECKSLWNILRKKNKRNVIIVGEAGVGKSALVEKLTYDIVADTAPAEFKGFKVISASINSMIAGTTYRGEAEERFKKLIEFLETHSKVILFIDEIHTILGAGSTSPSGGGADLSNALKPLLARGDTIVIGSTTTDEYEKYFKVDSALSRRFEKVKVEEPTSSEVYPMIKNKLDRLSDFHRVGISKEMVNYAILISHCFAFDKKNPDKTLDLIDRAMVTAKSSGKESVDKQSILDNFDVFFETWKNMSEESKKATAYHEAGHYIVGKASGLLIDERYLAVSIMPAEYYLGVTVSERDKNAVPFKNLDYYIDVIAANLAGRVAEKKFTHVYESGAESDLRTATYVAHDVVTKYGLIEDESLMNRVYIDSKENSMLSEKSTNIINDEVNKLIQQGLERAQHLLDENQDILEAIVNALLEKHIMSEAELDKVWKDTVTKRQWGCSHSLNA